MPEAGETLQGKVIGGKYRLCRYLGGSERSAVFLTEYFDAKPRTAAIKLIPADSKTADLQLSRWRLISRLAHPHLLQILEMGRCRESGEELLYVVMEHAGESLAQILPQRPLTADETHEMLKSVLEALAYLHGRGFVHGHLKPSNILVAGEHLKLTSDCICRTGESDVAEGGTYGPPDPPGAAASPARDIWSLGVTVVEVLTQLLPVRNGRGITLPETLPPQFAELAENCLQSDPRRRCTLTEIAEHLHLPLPARTIGPPSLPPERSQARHIAPLPSVYRGDRTNRSTVSVAAAIFVLVAFVAGWNLLRRDSAPPVPTNAAEQQATVQEEAGPIGALSAAIPQSSRTADRTPAKATAQTAQPGERATLKAASNLGGAGAALSQPVGNDAVIRNPGKPSAPGVFEVVQQVLPAPPRSALNTIRGTVRVTVRVRVDAAGKVTGVSMVSAGPSRYFARLAEEASRQWRFSPARRDAQPAGSAWTIRYEYTRGGVRAIPAAAR